MDVYNGSLNPAINIYKRIMSELPEDTVLLVCPYAGTGDVYLVSLYIRKLMQLKHIDEYALVVIGNANYKIASLFNFSNIVKVTQEEADRLTYLYMALEGDFEGIIMMHHDPIQNYAGILENLRNINSTKFIDMYIHNVFHLDPVNDMQMPTFDYESKKIRKIFEINSLKEGKTVVLSPFVNTLPAIPWWVWIELARRLRNEGYIVCTNCGGPNEPPIEGTIGLRFDYDISVPILEKCGFFVGIRSGFCDVISSAKCKKVIIYQPYIFWGEGTNLDYFSLNKNGFCDDAIEIEYVGIEFYKLVDQVVEEIKKG